MNDMVCSNDIRLPAGMRVVAGAVESDRPLEDVVIFSRRRPAVIFFGLWLVFCFGGGGALDCVCNGHWLLSIPIVGFGIFGCWVLVFEFFGRHVLRFGSGTATYRVGVGPWHKELSFRVDAMTKAEAFASRRTGLVNQGEPISDVRILQDDCEDVRFGRWMPVGVQDAFATLVNRRAKGQPLVSGQGPNTLTTITHPIAFTVIFLGILFSAVYSTSGTKRVAIEDGSLKIIRSEWWGRRIEEKKVPVNDIWYIDFHFTGGPKSRRARLDVQDKNGKVLAQIEGPMNTMSRYQQRLMGLIRCGEKGEFDERYKTKLFFAGLAAFLLILCSPCCFSAVDQISIPADCDPEDPDYDLACLRRQSIESMRKKLARRKSVKPSGKK